MQILITIASVLFLGNKSLLLLGKKIDKKIGWFLGASAAVLFIVYFFLIEASILSVLEIGLTILMTYRFIAGQKTNKRIENVLGIVTGIIIIALTVIAAKGTMSVAQLLGALGMLIGTYLLISSRQIVLEFSEWKERLGWLLYGFGHFFTSYIGYQKHEWIFFVFQAWQMALCLVGFSISVQEERKKVTQAVLILGAISSAGFLIAITNYY